MTEHWFDGTPEGLRDARRMLAASWAIYLAHLAAFFVAPVVVYLSTPGDVWWLVGMVSVAAICVFDIFPQAWKVFMDPELDFPDILGCVSFLMAMVVLLVAAIFMSTKDPVLRAIGSLVWFVNHLFILGPPPRLEKEPT